MMNLRARKERSTIPEATLGVIGTVRIQAMSSKKLTLKIVWLRTESVPPHLAAAMMMVTSVRRAKGARM